MFDFIGYVCVNCCKMEENVWFEVEVYFYFKDDYVVISFYVDDKKKLDEFIIVMINFGCECELDEVGEKWVYF